MKNRSGTPLGHLGLEMKRSCVGLFLLWMILFLIQPAVANAEDAWVWVQTISTPNGWDVTQGKATVSIKGASLSAELFDVDGAGAPLVKLKGTIKGTRLKVHAVTQNADYGSSEMSGELKTEKWEGFADTIGRQTITLSDGWNQIGITRELRPAKKAHK